MMSRVRSDDEGALMAADRMFPLVGPQRARTTFSRNSRRTSSGERCKGYTTVKTLERIWPMVPVGCLSKPFFEDQRRRALEKVLETHGRRLSPLDSPCPL